MPALQQGPRKQKHCCWWPARNNLFMRNIPFRLTPADTHLLPRLLCSYFDPDTVGLDFEGMIRDIEAAPEGSIILLHGRPAGGSGSFPVDLLLDSVWFGRHPANVPANLDPPLIL